MKKIFSLLVVASVVFATAACSSKTTSEDYNYVFTRDIATMDYVSSYRNTDHIHNVNFVDGLTETDPEGVITASLAESWSHNDDNTVWTYKIRKGVKWVDSAGNEKAEVTAKDWVTALQHAADFNSQTLYLVQGSVVGLDDYVNGVTTDFSTVGVKAVDDYTLEYTLAAPEPYWNSKTLYTILYPINQEFLESKGTGCKLGSPDKANCTFGNPAPDSILYNGAYILSSITSKTLIQYTANESYWDKKHVYIQNVNLVYYDGSDPDSLVRNFTDGKYSAARIYTSNPAFYQEMKQKYADNIYTTKTGTLTYNLTVNYNRSNYDHSAKTTDKQKQDTAAALANKNFRLALMFGMDRSAYRAILVGDDLKSVALRNSLVPYDFVKPSNAKTYGELVSKELTALDPVAFPSGFDLTDGQDPYYNPTLAKQYLEKAKAELTGVSWPVRLDLLADETATVQLSADKALQATIEASLGTDNVKVDVVPTDSDTYDAATYGSDQPAANDWDISNASGWGPDYADPKTYLEIYNPDSGDMLTTLGFSTSTSTTAAQEKPIKTALGLYEYQALLEAADAEVTNLDTRYALYAKADAWLIANAIEFPINADGGTPAVSKVVPFTAPYTKAGSSDSKFKYMQVGDKVVTTAEYQKAKDEWTKKIEAAK